MTETELDDDEESAGREIVSSRVFDVARERLFKAWTDPDQLKQ